MWLVWTCSCWQKGHLFTFMWGLILKQEKVHMQTQKKAWNLQASVTKPMKQSNKLTERSLSWEQQDAPLNSRSSYSLCSQSFCQVDAAGTCSAARSFQLHLTAFISELLDWWRHARCASKPWKKLVSGPLSLDYGDRFALSDFKASH